MTRNFMRGWTVAAIAGLLGLTAEAVWMEQTIPLKAGWNAIHVKVNPYEAACADFFGPNVDQVTWWNPDDSDDGTGIVASDSYTWETAAPEVNTFGCVIGGACYLVHATVATNLTVVGTPALPKSAIRLGQQNQVGLWVPNGGAATASLYFGLPADWLALDACYAVSVKNTAVLQKPSAQLTNPSQAFWLNTVGTGTKSYMGPLELSVDSTEKILHWEKSSLPRAVTVRNLTDKPRTVTFGFEASLPPPAGQGTKAGDIQLLREVTDWSQGIVRRSYVPIEYPFATNLEAGATFTMKVRPNTKAQTATEGDYLGILVVSDAGTESLLSGVRAKGVCEYRVGLKSSASLSEEANVAGLWIGNVSLTGVNRAQMLTSADQEWDAEKIQDATQSFEFPLIVHVADGGAVKLLKQAFVGSDVANDRTATVMADKATAKAFRRKYPTAKIRRVSSANFPFMSPLAFDGAADFQKDGGVLTATVAQSFDAKDNPFQHRFHPNHDNLAFNNGKPSWKEDGAAGTGDYESWTVTRTVKLTFAGSDPAGYADADWNRTVCGGTYRETISGLNKTPVIVEGAFRLTKTLDTPVLTEGSVVE